ncbi:Stage 0 sporulation protein KC [Agrobacterium sp. DSM 25558]|uniref:ABC transporter permease n=1 Tax=Agrobacterium sp. DSM 25558 TaxID=1907665 RepID=UPI0009725225|nr:ABC transporter permease [Agrobacterium sp. DSM 25558]SCX18477.1 Stage 0 sporulation protein KC [Agrobacterium sp. DSM 25558]
MSHIAPSLKATGLSSPVASIERRRPPKGLAKLWSKARWTTRLYLLAFALVLLAAIFGPMLVPFDPNAQTLLARLCPPISFDRAMAIHPLGTDQLGRDLLSRTLHGLRLTMLIALIGSVISLLVGVVCGVIAGYVRGRTGALVMAIVDIQMAVPFTLVALLAVAIFGTALPILVCVIGLSGWEVYARIVRAQVLTVSRQPFVEASKAAGASHFRILFHHVLPNVTSPIIVVWTMTFSSLILLESSLSFLGLGVQPPTATLGSMVGLGRDYLASSPWIAVVPALVIMFVSLLVLLIGDWLRATLDVKLK